MLDWNTSFFEHIFEVSYRLARRDCNVVYLLAREDDYIDFGQRRWVWK